MKDVSVRPGDGQSILVQASDIAGFRIREVTAHPGRGTAAAFSEFKRIEEQPCLSGGLSESAVPENTAADSAGSGCCFYSGKGAWSIHTFVHDQNGAVVLSVDGRVLS